MKNIRLFLSENFYFLVVKFSVYLNRCVFVMTFSEFRRKFHIVIKALSSSGGSIVSECRLGK